MSTQSRSVPVRRGAPLFFPRRAHLLTTRKRAVVLPSAVVRSPRGMRPLRGPAGNDRRHSRCVWSSAVRRPAPYASENLPPAAFRYYGGRWTRDGRRRTEVIKTGDLSFRGKGYQSGDRPLRCRGGGLHELFPNLQ